MIRATSKHPVLPVQAGIRVKCLDKCSDVPLERTQRVWIDVESPSIDEVAKLKAMFSLNPLALEDALEKGHWSK